MWTDSNTALPLLTKSEVAAGQLPSTLLRGRVRFRREDLDKYVARLYREPTPGQVVLPGDALQAEIGIASTPPVPDASMMLSICGNQKCSVRVVRVSGQFGASVLRCLACGRRLRKVGYIEERTLVRVNS